VRSTLLRVQTASGSAASRARLSCSVVFGVAIRRYRELVLQVVERLLQGILRNGQITVLQPSKHLITVVICSRLVPVCDKEKFHRSFSLTNSCPDKLYFVVLGCRFKRISKSSETLINRGFCGFLKGSKNVRPGGGSRTHTGSDPRQILSLLPRPTHVL